MSAQTLRNWDKNGKLHPHHTSSNKQKDDLERQIENMKQYLTAQGKPFEIISDIGSGINYKKKD